MRWDYRTNFASSFKPSTKCQQARETLIMGNLVMNFSFITLLFSSLTSCRAIVREEKFRSSKEMLKPSVEIIKKKNVSKTSGIFAVERSDAGGTRHLFFVINSVRLT